MCKYCKNLETADDWLPIAKLDIDFGILEKGQLTTWLGRNEKGEPCMVLDMLFDVAGLNAIEPCKYKKIHYCPMCGRKLE